MRHYSLEDFCVSFFFFERKAETASLIISVIDISLSMP